MPPPREPAQTLDPKAAIELLPFGFVSGWQTRPQSVPDCPSPLGQGAPRSGMSKGLRLPSRHRDGSPDPGRLRIRSADAAATGRLSAGPERTAGKRPKKAKNGSARAPSPAQPAALSGGGDTGSRTGVDPIVRC